MTSQKVSVAESDRKPETTGNGNTNVVLGVKRSLGNSVWLAAPSLSQDNSFKIQVEHLTRRYGNIPTSAGYVLAWKSCDENDVETFMEPTIRRLLPDPSRFLDMDRAVARLADAVCKGSKVGVLGDYDVDGVVSSSLLVRILGGLGSQVEVHIPDRRTEGYGPNEPALRALVDRGAEILVTVDCGVSAHEPLAAMAEAGTDVIVMDHHPGGDELPRAHSVVNPNRRDEDGQYGYLCAAGVVFIALVGLVRELRRRGFFKADKKEPDLLRELGIVGLATVCDVVPMKGLNRAFVRQGLKSYASRDNVGLSALGDVSGQDAPASPHTFGFAVGPRINAAGRIGSAQQAVALLTATDGSVANGIAMALDKTNTERRNIENTARIQALEMAASQNDRKVVMVHGENWHEGVIGIVAGRICEKTGKPALVLARASDGGWKGSGRSIPGFGLGDAIVAAREAKIIEKGGGHAMAAGFQVGADNLDAFHDFMCDRFAKEYEGEPIRERHVAGYMSARGLIPELVDWLDAIGPYGVGNAEPRFAVPDCTVNFAKLVGQDGAHITCGLVDGTGCKMNAILFNGAGTDVGNGILREVNGAPLHVLGRIRKSHYQGTVRVQFEIEDAALSDGVG